VKYFACVRHRQLEAIVRISESLAKMSLSPFATEIHVDEALRLFQVSTLEAAMSGNLSGNQDVLVCSDDNGLFVMMTVCTCL